MLGVPSVAVHGVPNQPGSNKREVVVIRELSILYQVKYPHQTICRLKRQSLEKQMIFKLIVFNY